IKVFQFTPAHELIRTNVNKSSNKENSVGITWDEIVAKIHFLNRFDPSLLTAYTTSNIDLPDDNFSEMQKDIILQSLKLIFEASQIAQVALSDFFAANELEIARNADDFGSWHLSNLGNIGYDNNIFIDVTQAGTDYLNLSGSISQFSLGFI